MLNKLQHFNPGYLTDSVKGDGDRGGGGGLRNPPSGGGNFTRGGFFSAGEHLRRSAFDHLQLCQIKKHLSVDIERQLVGSKSMTLK